METSPRHLECLVGIWISLTSQADRGRDVMAAGGVKSLDLFGMEFSLPASCVMLTAEISRYKLSVGESYPELNSADPSR